MLRVQPIAEWMHHVKVEYYFQKLARIGEFYACLHFRCYLPNQIKTLENRKAVFALLSMVIITQQTPSTASDLGRTGKSIRWSDFTVLLL